MPMQRVALPLPASVNHLYRRVTLPNGRVIEVKTDKAKRWDKDAALLAKACASRHRWRCRPKGQKVVVEVWAYWPDARRRDMNNLHKQIADVLEGIVYEDDTWALLRDMDFDVDRANPRVEVRWYDGP